MDTIQKGVTTELQCELDFVRLGYIISKPIQPCRYDYLVDIGNKIIKIQCKTSHSIDDNAIMFCCRSSRGVKQGKTEHVNYSSDEIDYFYTSWDGTGYLVPVTECNTAKTLRFVMPVNCNATKVTLAQEYEIQKILKRRENA